MKKSFDQKAILLHARILEDEQATDKESDSDFDFSNDDGEDQALGNDENTPPMDQSQNAAPPQMPTQDDTGRAAVDALANVAQTLAKGKIANDKSQLDAGFDEDLYDQSVLETGDPNGDDVSDATLNNPLGDEMSLEDDEKQVLEAFRKFKNNKLNERAKNLYKKLSEVRTGECEICHNAWATHWDQDKDLYTCDNCRQLSGEIEWPEEYSNEGDIGLSSKEKRDRVARNRRKSGSLKDSKAKSLYKKISEHYLDGASRFDYDSEPSEADEELDSWATRNGHKPDQEIDEKDDYDFSQSMADDVDLARKDGYFEKAEKLYQRLVQ